MNNALPKTTKRGKSHGGGRKAGSKNAKTVAREVAHMVAGTAVARVTAGVVVAKARVKDQGGITPKDLLLSAMHTSWSAAHALNLQAMKTQEGADKLSGNNGEAEIIEKRGLNEKATALRGAMQAQLAEATRLASLVAPYVHAKLANVEQRLVGNIIVELPKF